MVIQLNQPGTQRTQSWFPHLNAWNVSGLNINRWTPECEAWYQQLRQSIHQGTSRPLSSQDWRTMLRLTSTARTLVYRMDAAAATYLESDEAGSLVDGYVHLHHCQALCTLSKVCVCNAA